jgi:hypothetical protein
MSVITVLSPDLQLEVQTTQQLCQVIDSPRSLTVHLLLRYQEWSQLLDLTIDPNNYDDIERFRFDYLVTKVMSKSPALPTGIDKKEVAVLAFQLSEDACKQKNEYFSITPESSLPLFMWDMKRYFAQLLPPVSEVSDQILELCAHGPGSTTGVRGFGSTIADKYQSKIELTANLIPFSKSIMGELWHSANYQPRKIVRGSKFTTVPKTAKTDRGICIEPTLNMFFQKGIGAFIRKRLKRFGLDLDLQSDKNREAARLAYSLNYSTIDLSMASDSISLKLLERLLPPDWYHLLMLARSPTTTIDGKTVELEKVSSMGNGFTFELESALFYFLSLSVIPRSAHEHIFIFGDDIICPRSYVDELIKSLNFLGFSVNSSKSFLEGNFFESCGTDWFKGHQVRPFFMKGPAPGVPYSLSIANRLRTWCSYLDERQCDHRFRHIWLSLIKKVPANWRKCRVPEVLGDVGLITSKLELLHKRKKNSLWYEGFDIKTIVYVPVSQQLHGYGVLFDAYARRDVPENATYGKVPVRGLFGSSRPRWTSLLDWPSGLEWDDIHPL